MEFADRLDMVVAEAVGGMMDAAGKAQLAKQNQRTKIIERAADQAVQALEQILRVLKLPDYKGDASFDALAAQLDNMVVGLGKDGNLRRSMSSLLTLPPETKGLE